jgi:solute:Na+ symporter, SSS family
MLDFAVVIIYLVSIVAIGVYVGKFSSTTSDFFFGGRRFTWWLVGMSCVATLVGSYSFIQYSEVGYSRGFPSLGPYTNEWFALPIFLGAWLPICYYNRLESVPEYFEKRFNSTVRKLVIVFLAIYLTGYIGVNLLTIGVAMKGIIVTDPALSASLGFGGLNSLPSFGGFLDWQIIVPAVIVAVLSAAYLHSGGQTSVILTDVIQGFLLLFVGLGVVGLGIYRLGGFGALIDGMPSGNTFPFAEFNRPAGFHFVGDFWNDAAVGTFSFYVINQGILMRFLSARSVQDGRKAMIFVAMILMPLAAISVGGAGWVGSALVSQGLLPADVSAQDIFITVSKFVAMPGVYGFVVAAVIAALMSTLDTLITAVCAVVVNDIVRPMYPGESDAFYLKIAKQCAVVVTIVGICLIPVFSKFESIYKALSHFTSIVIPPLIIVVMFGIMTKRFNSKCAVGTLVVGGLALIFSMFVPDVIVPVAHGVDDPNKEYSYMRALFGLLTSGGAALVFLFMYGKEEEGKTSGLTIHKLDDALHQFKGGKPCFKSAGQSLLLGVTIAELEDSEAVRLPEPSMNELSLSEGDVLYVTDTGWWWGGLRSVHTKVGPPADGDQMEMSELLFKKGGFAQGARLRVEKVF